MDSAPHPQQTAATELSRSRDKRVKQARKGGVKRPRAGSRKAKTERPRFPHIRLSIREGDPNGNTFAMILHVKQLLETEANAVVATEFENKALAMKLRDDICNLCSSYISFELIKNSD